ncbi:protein translocase subunit SecF [Candidatus Berkiella cookevillensis]|uniref:Protein-export membrane protein SecF n=1 Tax=Candidatus Berkiella cookevillensis TaxID=437022 RepID=A0A0Q9YF18_9GAMM|nr:protein translocase subunit SecF [Candidatus Berkiella cookevillensis]MCS5708730.1 protein translocase subunit SecF [Candidatus Berkiella cookevillensis]
MEFFKNIPHIDFMGQRKITAVISISVFIISVTLLFMKGLNFGLDFTGGTQLELRYDKPVDVDSVNEQLAAAGFSSTKVTQYGAVNDILLKIANKEDMTEDELGHKVLEALRANQENVELLRIEFVGAEVGAQLAEQGALAVLVALFATMIYIAMRFEYRFGISAAIALLHDPILILGIFAYYQIEFDLATLAGILAAIGYSLNDTIVVFDRVRENFRKVRKSSAVEIMNMSINQTLSRTIMTSATTLLVVVALFLFGGDSLHGFSTALLIGILIGTYSSIYVAGALAVAFGLSKADLMGAPKKLADDMP